MATRRPILIAAQPLHGGVAAHVIQLVEGLPPQEFEINVACPRESTIWTELEGRDGVVLHRIRPHREPGAGDLGRWQACCRSSGGRSWYTRIRPRRVSLPGWRR